MIERVDYEAAEAVEVGLDELINRRSASQEEANRTEELWKASACRHRAAVYEANREAWIAFHRGLARSHAELAESHAERAARLEAKELLAGEGKA